MFGENILRKENESLNSSSLYAPFLLLTDTGDHSLAVHAFVNGRTSVY